MRRLSVAALTVLALLASCSGPPDSSYVGGGPLSARGASGVSLGANTSGEACNQLATGGAGGAEIFCGTWQEPAARVQSGGTSSGGSPMDVATSSPWRDALDVRFACAAPVSTSILGGQPAALLRCVRRVGGWPQIALVAQVRGQVYRADGIQPTLPVMERSIAILSGLASGSTVDLPGSEADTLIARQLAAHAFGAGDVETFERLMAVGARTNLAENFAAAEIAYRAALALQQKLLGRDNPDTVNPLMHLALQLSDQQRFAEATTVFRQADALVARANDAVAPARLYHYEALHALNQGQRDQALTLLDKAAVAYRARVPAETLRPAAPSLQLVAAQTGSMSNAPAMLDPAIKSALIGLIEVYRYQAIVFRQLGRQPDSAAAMARAASLTHANQMDVPLVAARLTRTAATSDDAIGNAASAESGLSTSRLNFGQVVPNSRPVAVTALLQAGVAAKRGDTAQAVELCRAGTRLLRALYAGTEPALLEPCLTAFYTEASRAGGERQSLLREMLEIAELAQDTITSRQIDEAAARLATNARDPKAAAAIRRRQDAADALSARYRERDALAGNRQAGQPVVVGAADPAALDKAVAAAQAELGDADAAMQAAVPNYGQIVQQVVPAADVLAQLGPDEAMAAVTLTPRGGWVFVLRAGTVMVAPVAGDAAAIRALVKRVRASIESPDGSLPPFDTAAARSLYEATLGQVPAGLAAAKSLIVVPSGALLSIPFGLLLTGPADPNNLPDAPWLIRKMAISHVPSAANFVALRKAGQSRATQAWYGFGGFHPATLAQATATFPSATCRDSAKLFAGLPPLPFAQKELDAAAALLGGRRADELLNAAFTADAVRHTNLKDYRILHFATHALLPAELKCQDEPAIVTSASPRAANANGSLLTASDITGLDLDANTVILSACNSGGPGGATSGESLSGLARAFFFAGARSMLVTHWSINDQSSAFLVADTLHRLSEHPGDGMASALRAAQIGMIERAGKDFPASLAHPFFWAPFALIGEGRTRSSV